jgi:hypothetical protein
MKLSQSEEGIQEMQFRIFTKLLGKHYMSFSEEGLCEALDGLLRAVMEDVKRYQKHDKSHTMDIAQACHIVRKIA